MLDSLPILAAMLMGAAGLGALVGWTRAQAAGARSFSWIIVAASALVGMLPEVVVMAVGFLACREIIHWGGPYRSMGVIEGLFGLALGAACAAMVGYRFSYWQHHQRHRWLTRNQH